jgi:outer membrane protein OmpA-like peptidoglycan-associated protein
MLITSRLIVIFLVCYGWTLSAQEAQTNHEGSSSLVASNRQHNKLLPAGSTQAGGTKLAAVTDATSGLTDSLDSTKVKQSDALNNVFAMQLALLQSHSFVPRYPLLAHQYFYRNGLSEQVARPALPLSNDAVAARETVREMPQSAEAAEEIFANGIYFEAGTAKLLDKSKPQLNKIYTFLDKHPDKRLSLVAMQEIGTRTNTLMYVRARAVQNYLVRMGLDPDRVRVKKEAFKD